MAQVGFERTQDQVILAINLFQGIDLGGVTHWGSGCMTFNE